LPGASRGRWISLSPCYFRSPLWPGLSLTNPAALSKAAGFVKNSNPGRHIASVAARAHTKPVVYSRRHICKPCRRRPRHGTARRSMTLLRFSKNSRASAKRARAARRAQVRAINGGDEGLPAFLQECSRRRPRRRLGRDQECGALSCFFFGTKQTWFSFNPKQRMEGFFLKGCNKKGDMDALPAIKD
jgi:hypothetical protein